MGKSPQTWNFWVILAVVGGLAMPGQAQEIEPVDGAAHGLSDTAAVMAQVPNSVVQITNIRLETTETGLQILLETADGELAVPTTTVSGNALIADIPNTVLALPDADEFQQFEPAEGIALIQVTELPGDGVQVVITGADAAPIAEVNMTATGLTLTLTPGIAQADTADDTLRLVVTGEEGSDYVESNASTGTRTDTLLRDIPQSIQVIPREVLDGSTSYSPGGCSAQC